MKSFNLSWNVFIHKTQCANVLFLRFGVWCALTDLRKASVISESARGRKRRGRMPRKKILKGENIFIEEEQVELKSFRWRGRSAQKLNFLIHWSCISFFALFFSCGQYKYNIPIIVMGGGGAPSPGFGQVTPLHSNSNAVVMRLSANIWKISLWKIPSF